MRYDLLTLLPDRAFIRSGRRMTLEGGGGSSSTSATTTTSVDKRLVVDSGVGVSSDQSTVNVQALDGGAIAGALDSANKSLTAARDATATALQFARDQGGKAIDFAHQNDALFGANVQDLLGLTDRVFQGAFDVIDKNAALVQSSGQLVATAWDNSKGEGTQKQYLAYGVVAVVMIVAVATMHRGK